MQRLPWVELPVSQAKADALLRDVDPITLDLQVGKKGKKVKTIKGGKNIKTIKGGKVGKKGNQSGKKACKEADVATEDADVAEAPKKTWIPFRRRGAPKRCLGDF